LIKEIIFLVPKSHAAKTIPATDTIKAKRTFAAIFAELNKTALITIPNIDAFITTLAIDHIHTVHDVVGSDDQIGIENIFSMNTRRKIAVLGINNEGIVFTIRRIEDKVRKDRDFSLQFLHLFEKRPIPIDLLSIFTRIPTITPPTLATVDREKSISRKNRHHRFLTLIALSLVKIALVAEDKSALLPAVGAHGEFQHVMFRDKRPISVGDFEVRLALGTGIHGIRELILAVFHDFPNPHLISSYVN
jgi:hypothetical protein